MSLFTEHHEMANLYDCLNWKDERIRKPCFGCVLPEDDLGKWKEKEKKVIHKIHFQGNWVHKLVFFFPVVQPHIYTKQVTNSINPLMQIVMNWHYTVWIQTATEIANAFSRKAGLCVQNMCLLQVLWNSLESDQYLVHGKLHHSRVLYSCSYLVIMEIIVNNFLASMKKR